ncbi:MAG: carbohydrate binding family 9 domain-containing protein [Acidobacteria bacterium]|nr:carbohydrate binding family 9 domain-containing protein [Acidobacteriota bacterium]
MLLASLLTASVLAATAADPPRAPADIEAIRASKRATAVRIEQPIVIDGLLDEAAWQLAEPATDFYQQQPTEFELSTRREEVRFLYTDSTLYVGAMLYDPAPERVIINDLKRDFNGRDSDMFGVVLDTFLDRRNAFGFLTNPGGAQRETQSYDNGRRADANWHGIWFVRTAIRPNGWTAEIAIPFKTLRFPERPEQEWGLNLVRVARRDNETTTWSPVPRQFSHYNVAYAGVLKGIAGVRRGRHVQAKPFATGSVGRGEPEGGGWTGDGDGGLDAKWGITSSLVLDGTFRTDFSQVEADEQQINLTRFSLFFPEKREFFLESPGSFQIGIVEPENQEPRRDLLPFFSRRIGLRGGRPVPVIGGLRLTGRAGRNGVGILTVQTREFEDVPGDNFSAVRLTRDLSASVTAGVFYFGREASGAAAFNRVAGADLRYRPVRTLEMEAFAMRSSTVEAESDWAGRAGLRLDHRAHRARATLVHVGDAFRHDLGFVRRPASGTFFGEYTRVLRPARTDTAIREYTIGADAEITADDRYRDVLTRVGGVSFGIVFADGGDFKAGVTTTRERILEGFPLGASGLTVAAGEYAFEHASVSYQSNKSAALSGNIHAQIGEFWDGRQRTATGGLRVRVNQHFSASVTIGRNSISLPQGAFDPTLLGLRLDYSFTPRMFLNAFVQYNGDLDAWLSNVRLNLIHRPLSDIYVVWNEVRLAGATRRALQFKYTHLVAF